MISHFRLIIFFLLLKNAILIVYFERSCAGFIRHKGLMKNICLGILAHVDAGKTSLCESLLYKTETIRSAGKVDNKDSFFDTDDIERGRGITVYSKTALIKTDKLAIQLVDTPGHVDFGSETERTLKILDYAVITVSGLSGVQSHTKTLFRLLERYNIPCFVFVNKMDIAKKDKDELLKDIRSKLSLDCIDFTGENIDGMYEEISLSDEAMMNKYLETFSLEDSDISYLISKRKIFPVFFGSAVKHTGIDTLLEALERFTVKKDYTGDFSGIVYKISRDKTGLRLTHIKVSGGTLKAKQSLEGEKINQIRLYNGDKFDVLTEVHAGSICVLTGLSKSYIGQCFGDESTKLPKMEPVLSYRMVLDGGQDAKAAYPKLRILNEEEPELDISYNASDNSLNLRLMGEVQSEVLKTKIKERFDLDVEFTDAHMVYKESIKNEVLGLGHFEPLRHYAEVHLLIKPAKRGQGINVVSRLKSDNPGSGSTGSIAEQLKNSELKGVLMGLELTDLEIEIVNAKIHNKHTEGGDLREAAFRALRQGLMHAESILLEPYYDFELVLPEGNLGRALNDLNNMSAVFESPDVGEGLAYIKGYVPLATIQNYNISLASYTGGEGSLSLSFREYGECHNEKEVLENNTYKSEFDTENPAYSIFCSHGEAFIVEWDKVHEYIHLSTEGDFYNEKVEEEPELVRSNYDIEKATSKELMEIFERTYGKVVSRVGDWDRPVRKAVPEKEYVFKKQEKLKEYILIDGYNVIFAWAELRELMNINIDAARDRLIDIISAYKAYISAEVIIVFDAYKVPHRGTDILRYHNIDIVYTKTAETADQYIEKTAKKMVKKDAITVVTSDGLEQIIIRSTGCLLMSSRELKEEIDRISAQRIREHKEGNINNKNYLLDGIDERSKKVIEDIRLGKKKEPL